ncbi:MAG: hypothetical protein J7M25_01810 [Deltaproteobacteria bacterium]|nr:hypothetical protein [Deltaproteobacteria bacterium]
MREPRYRLELRYRPAHRQAAAAILSMGVLAFFLSVLSGMAGCEGRVTSSGSLSGFSICSRSADCRNGDQCIDHYCIGAGCSQECLPGQRQCQTDGVVICERDVNHCPFWTKPQPCQDGERCVEGLCQDVGSCQDACTLDATTCSNGGNTVQVCSVGPGGCLSFVDQTPCDEHQVCNQGACVCNDSCQASQQRCNANGHLETCQGPDADGCTFWAEEVTCGEHQTCTNNACTCSESCQAGQTQCGPGGGQQTCQGPDADGCTFWGAEEDCYDTMQCDADRGKCMPHTSDACYDVNECLYYGQKICQPDGVSYRQCSYGDDGCLHWDCST